MLSFDLTVDHPYKFILAFVKMLKCDRIVAQYAWNFVNDRSVAVRNKTISVLVLCTLVLE